MRLRNILIVVEDMERAKRFYHDLFGLRTILDQDGNMILTEGLVLQEERYWKEFLQRDSIPRNNHGELYFEEAHIEEFVEKLECLYPDTEYVNRLMTHSWGQKLQSSPGSDWSTICTHCTRRLRTSRSKRC